MKRFHLGCSVVRDGACGNYTAEQICGVLDRYDELGVRFIEFSHPQRMEEDQARCIREYAGQRGLIPWSAHCCPLVRRDDGDNRDQVAHDARIARCLGARVLVFHQLSHPDPMADYLYAAEQARRNGLTLAIETGTGPLSWRQLIELVQAIGREDVGICIDTGHSFLRDLQEVDEVIRDVGPLLKTLHLHDNYGTHDDHQPPGLGYMDWQAVLCALRQSPYEGPLMLEMTDSKQGRAVPQLRTLPIDTEILLAKAWLTHLWQGLTD